MEDSELQHMSDHQMSDSNNKKITKPNRKRAGVTMKKSANGTGGSKTSRQPLQDRTNRLDEMNDEEEDDLNSAGNKSKAKSTKRSQIANHDMDEEMPASKKAKMSKSSKSTSATQKARPAQVKSQGRSPNGMDTIPETQPVDDISESVEMYTDAVDTHPAQTNRGIQRGVVEQRYTQPYASSRQRSVSQQPQQFSREGSALLVDRRTSDNEARRRLADMTSKYEDLRLRYESLSELGTNGAESNFEKLKRATDQRSKNSNDLIASLKKELADIRKASSTTTSNHARLQTQCSTLQTENEQYQSKMNSLESSVSDIQSELKVMTTKYENMRKRAVTAETTSTGSGNGGNSDNTGQRLKDALYQDLTGLTVRTVTRKDGEDEYNCTQSGKNGSTLIFSSSLLLIYRVINVVFSYQFSPYYLSRSFSCKSKDP